MIPNLNKWHFIKLHRKKRITNLGKGNKGKKLSIYKTGLILKESKVLTINQIDSVKKFINKKLKGKTKNKYKNQKQNSTKKKKRRSKNIKEKTVIIRKNINLGLTKKPLQVRMGKGKGAPVDWVYPISKNRVFLEFVTKKFKYSKLLKIFEKINYKLPTHIKIRRSLEKKVKSFNFDKIKLK